MSRDDGDPGDSCSPLPASFSHRPHPPRSFVENKGSTPLRKACQKPVDPVFLCFSAVKSASIPTFVYPFYCPVGRGSQRVRGILLLADCWLSARFSKERRVGKECI